MDVVPPGGEPSPAVLGGWSRRTAVTPGSALEDGEVTMRDAQRFISVLFLAAACGGDGSVTAPEVAERGEAAAGRAAFLANCASCHASRDGFDLAYFGFPESDVIRRAVGHVDDATARDIAAWIDTLDVEPRGRAHRLFQPAGRLVSDDLQLWRDVFGTPNWPDDLTPASLAAIDLRDVAVPLGFPLWSSESDESDWLPEHPLPAADLAADGGALGVSLDAYYAGPDIDSLLRVIAIFQTITRDGGPMADPVCRGSAGAHAYPVECFEARRWISSLAAVHLLRAGEERDVPHEIARIWWDTGEAAVTGSFRASHITRRDAVAWLYLGSIFAADGFLEQGAVAAEDAGYMGQFLVSEGLSRLAVLVTLRRMVASGPIHDALPEQAYWDLRLAVLRAPVELRADVAEFGFGFLLERQAEGHVPVEKAATFAGQSVTAVLTILSESGGSGDAQRDAAIRAGADLLLARLEEAAAGQRQVPAASGN